MIEAQKAKEMMERAFAQRRKKGILSHAHDETHVTNVARYGRILAEGIAKKEGIGESRDKSYIYSIDDVAEAVKHVADTAELAGYLHDIVRQPTEKVPHGAEGAKWIAYASYFTKTAKEAWGVMPDDCLSLNREELATVAFALIEHEKTLADVIRLSRFDVNADEKAIVAVSMKICDALLEASGFRVVERRCFFVGNERMHNGDLQFLKENELTKDKPHVWAVLGESIVRLYARNPLTSYPEWLRGVASRLHAIQYRFYANLIKMTGEYQPTDELKIVKLLAQMKFPKVDDKLIGAVEKQRHLTSGYLGQFPEIGEATFAAGMDNPLQLAKIMENVSMAADTAQAYAIWKDAAYENYFAHGVVDYNEGACDFADMAVESYVPGKK